MSHAEIQSYLDSIKLIATIGDITVHAHDTFVFIRVDDVTMISMSRESQDGLEELADTLKRLVI